MASAHSHRFLVRVLDRDGRWTIWTSVTDDRFEQGSSGAPSDFRALGRPGARRRRNGARQQSQSRQAQRSPGGEGRRLYSQPRSRPADLLDGPRSISRSLRLSSARIQRRPTLQPHRLVPWSIRRRADRLLSISDRSPRSTDRVRRLWTDYRRLPRLHRERAFEPFRRPFVHDQRPRRLLRKPSLPRDHPVRRAEVRRQAGAGSPGRRWDFRRRLRGDVQSQ